MLWIIYATVVGLAVGSAINAIVWRLYVGRSWTKGRSECPECHHQLAPKDLIPVISWLSLRGRCRYCRAPIKDSPIVEALTAGLFGLSAAVIAPVGWVSGGRLVLWLVLLTLLLILAVYDARWMILPDKIMLPAIGVGLVYAGYLAATAHSWAALGGPALAALGAGGLFYAVAALSRGRAMGGGDIKLAFLMGLVLGIKATLLALLIGFNVAAIVGIVLIVAKVKRRRDQIAFGPFLVLATVVAFLYGHAIVTWYLQINGLV